LPSGGHSRQPPQTRVGRALTATNGAAGGDTWVNDTAYPTTGTNKVVKRELARQKWRRDLIGADDVFVRDRGDESYRPFTVDDEASLAAAFDAAGRARFLDL